MDAEHGGGNSKHSGTCAVPSGGHAFAPQSSPESGSNKPPGTDPMASANVGEDLFQAEPKLILKSSASTTAISKPREEALLRDGSSDSFSKSDPTSPVSCLTHESTLQSTPSTRSPPIQVMERSGGDNPSGLSSSVFARNSPPPMEWSSASSESLFSLHIDNVSLTRDRIIELGGVLPMSGELAKSSKLISFRPSPPAAVGRECDRNVDVGNLAIGEGDEIMKNVPRGTASDHCEEKVPSLATSWNSSNTNRTLVVRSSKSFASAKKKKSAWPSCDCSNCSWTSCCCKWPSCRCKCPSCRCKCPSCCCKWQSCCCKWQSCCCKWQSCCCKWPSCSCKWPSCCCKWPSCCSFSNCSCMFCCCGNCRRKKIFSYPPNSSKDGGASLSVKGEPKQQHSQRPASKASKWYSCF